MTADQLVKYKAQKGGCCKEHEKHIANVTEQLEDLEKTSKSIEERLNQQQECMQEMM